MLPYTVAWHIVSGECTTLKKEGSQVWCKRLLEGEFYFLSLLFISLSGYGEFCHNDYFESFFSSFSRIMPRL